MGEMGERVHCPGVHHWPSTSNPAYLTRIHPAAILTHALLRGGGLLTESQWDSLRRDSAWSCMQSPEKHPLSKLSLRAWPSHPCPSTLTFYEPGPKALIQKEDRLDAITQEAFHSLPDPSTVPSDSPAEEVVKGHWEGKHGMGWARTYRHFLTSGTAAQARGKVDFSRTRPKGAPPSCRLTPYPPNGS